MAHVPRSLANQLYLPIPYIQLCPWSQIGYRDRDNSETVRRSIQLADSRRSAGLSLIFS